MFRDQLSIEEFMCALTYKERDYFTSWMQEHRFTFPLCYHQAIAYLSEQSAPWSLAQDGVTFQVTAQGYDPYDPARSTVVTLGCCFYTGKKAGRRMIVPEEHQKDFSLGETFYYNDLSNEERFNKTPPLLTYEHALMRGLATHVDGVEDQSWFLAGYLSAWKAETTPKPMSTRLFWQTTITYEVLSEEPVDEAMSLSEIEHACIEGDWSGRWIEKVAQEVDGATMARLLQEQGSDPKFFQLTETGADNEW